MRHKRAIDTQPATTKRFGCDVAIVGGGVAALWCARIALARGLSVVLLAPSIGGEQTFASQGIIHSGKKYSSPVDADALVDMPRQWRTLLAGQGEIDLSGVTVAAATMIAFDHVTGRSTPLDEPVIGIESLMRELWHPLEARSLKTRVAAENLVIRNGSIEGILVGERRIEAQRYLICAGEGNAEFVTATATNAPTRLRPVRQIVARARTTTEPLFRHVFDRDADPALTVTTHRIDGATYYYFGGRIATDAVAVPDFLARAKREIARLLPSFPVDEHAWATIYRDRAELVHADAKRRLDAGITSSGNVTICWPMKLCLVPRLAELLADTWPRTVTRDDIAQATATATRPHIDRSPLVAAFDGMAP